MFIAEEAVFNYRLAREYRTLECAFRMLSIKSRMCKEEVGMGLMNCTCILHNIVIHTERLPEELLREFLSIRMQ
jgi:hypothetical protein